MQTRNTFLKAMVAGGLSAALPIQVLSQAKYPTKPVQVWVGFPGGGALDVATRVVTDGVAAHGVAPMVIMNRPGASATVAAGQVARAEPDGYTLLLATSANMGIARYIYPKLTFDPERDFVPVAQFAVGQNVIYAGRHTGVTTFQQMQKMLRDRPGKLNFASPGRGTTPHLCFEMVKARGKLFVVHVPFNGSPAALTGVSAGEVEFGVDAIGPTLPFVRSSRIVPLAQTGTRRSSLLTDVPTLTELGYPNVPRGTYLGLVAPSGTPAPVIAQVQEAVKAFLATPAAEQRLSQVGFHGEFLDSAAFARAMQDELAMWSEAVTYSGAKNI